jgi:hypothetical protein
MVMEGWAREYISASQTWTANSHFVKCLIFLYGGMAERLKAPVLKTGRALKALVGSNPTPSVSVY